MQYAALVRRCEARDELARDVQRLFVREISDTRDKRCEILAVDELHRQEVLAVHFRDVVDAANIRMCQLPCNANLGEEPFASHGICRQLARQKLQRDSLSELEIV